MPINFAVSGSTLTVTINGEQLPPYSLTTQTPKYTTTANTVSFFFADGRYMNNLAFTAVSFAETAFSGTRTALEDRLNIMFAANSGNGSTASLIDDRIVYVGDSITAAQLLVNGNSIYYMANGFALYASVLSGSKFYQPINGNQGISGDTTANVIARLGAILELRPKVAVVLIGINDIRTSVPSNTTIANIDLIYKALKSINCKIIALTVYAPTTPYTPLTAPQETARVAVNNFIKSSTDTTAVVDTSTYVTSAMLYDGLHPNVIGAYTIGADVATKVSALLPSASTGFQIFPEALSNYYLTGTTGTKSGVSTGSVADGWTLDGTAMGGASLAGAKTTTGNLNQQVLTIGGNYTGNGNVVIFKQDFTNSFFVQNDIIEVIGDFEILSTHANIKAIKVTYSIFTAGYASNIHNGESHFAQGSDSYPLPIGRYTVKTPALKITGGVPAIIQYKFLIELKDAATSSAVSASVKLYRMGPRRTNTL